MPIAITMPEIRAYFGVTMAEWNTLTQEDKKDILRAFRTGTLTY